MSETSIAHEFVNLYEFEAAARERLETMAYAYYASGANDDITLRMVVSAGALMW